VHAGGQRRPLAGRARDALRAADTGRAVSARLSGVRVRGPERRPRQRHRARGEMDPHPARLRPDRGPDRSGAGVGAALRSAPPAAWRPPPTATWRLPPRGVLRAAVVLLVAAELGGASMGPYKVELQRWARTGMLAHPAVHGLVGVRDVDERVLDEALFRFDAGLRLFHMHAEGMALVVIAATTVAATLAR